MSLIQILKKSVSNHTTYRFRNMLVFLIITHLMGIGFFALFRLGFVIINIGSFYDGINSIGFGEFFHSFVLGFVQDSAYHAFVLLGWWVCIIVGYLLGIRTKAYYRWFGYVLFLFYVISFIICGADIGYILRMQAHMDGAIFNWISQSPGIVMGMIGGMWHLSIPIFIVGVAICYMWLRLQNRRIDRYVAVLHSVPPAHLRKLPLSIKIPLLLFYGTMISLMVDAMMKGDIQKVYIYSNPEENISRKVLGSFGLFDEDSLKDSNRKGVSHYYRTWYVKPTRTMPVQHPLNQYIQQNNAFCLLNVLSNNGEMFRGQGINLWTFPTIEGSLEDVKNRVLGRMGRTEWVQTHTYDSVSPYKHVVVLMLEGCASLDEYKKLNTGLTPFLDSLSLQSLNFTNALSTGEQTKFGIIAALLGESALKHRDPITRPHFSDDNLPRSLSKHGFYSTYVIPHPSNFDNLVRLKHTIFDEIIYPVDHPEVYKHVGVWGLNDEAILKASLSIISEKVKTHENTFTYISTISNHSPFDNLSDDFTNKYENPHHSAIAYADDALRMFFEEAKDKPWFDSTLFVLYGDHGDRMIPTVSPVRKVVHKFAMMFYAPKYIKPKTVSSFAMQEDIYPTTMSLLRRSYSTSKFGIDLSTQTRDIAYYTNSYGKGKFYVFNDTAAYMEGEPGQLFLYKKDYTNRGAEYPVLRDSLRRYAEEIYYLTAQEFY